MGLLVNGEWQDQWYDTKKHGGEFVRESAQLRDWWVISRRLTVNATRRKKIVIIYMSR